MEEITQVVKSYYDVIGQKDEDIFELYRDNKRLRTEAEDALSRAEEREVELGTQRLLVAALQTELCEKNTLLAAHAEESAALRTAMFRLREILDMPSELDHPLEDVVAACAAMRRESAALHARWNALVTARQTAWDAAREGWLDAERAVRAAVEEARAVSLAALERSARSARLGLAERLQWRQTAAAHRTHAAARLAETQSLSAHLSEAAVGAVALAQMRALELRRLFFAAVGAARAWGTRLAEAEGRRQRAEAAEAEGRRWAAQCAKERRAREALQSAQDAHKEALQSAQDAQKEARRRAGVWRRQLAARATALAEAQRRAETAETACRSAREAWGEERSAWEARHVQSEERAETARNAFAAERQTWAAELREWTAAVEEARRRAAVAEAEKEKARELRRVLVEQQRDEQRLLRHMAEEKAAAVAAAHAREVEEWKRQVKELEAACRQGAVVMTELREAVHRATGEK